MKPAAFAYEKPGSLDHAIRSLAAGGEARLMGGGQTLGPMLNLRLATPERIIDLGSIVSLRRMERDGTTLTIGAGVTHAMIEDSPDMSPTSGLLSYVASAIAFRAIRNRGTIGGSLAHADPAADWVATMLLLDAQISLFGPSGSRHVPAHEFFKGAFSTDLRPNEIIESVRIEELSDEACWGYYRICQKVGEFPQAIGAIVLDPARRIARVIAGALEGPPVLLQCLAVAVARDGLAGADLAGVKRALEGAAPGMSAVDLQIHAVAVRRAISQAVSP
jgi:carbon-monoxide dehydrogenase medium subunit